MIETVFSKLAKLDADVYGIKAGRIVWKSGSVDRFTAEGRKNNLLFYMLSGERGYYINNEPLFKLKKDEIIFIPITACYTSKVENCECSEGIYVDFGLRLGTDSLYVNEPFKLISAGGKYLNRFHTLVEAGNELLRAKSELTGILAEISACDEASYFQSGEFSSIYTAILEIEKNPENPVDITALAKLCCLSETGFREKFKCYSGGVAPIEYRNRLRIDRADELIGAGSFSISHIADILGFYDSAHFYRVYKKQRGYPPGAERNRGK